MKKSILISTLIAAAALAAPAFADELTWAGSSGDSWTTTGAWSGSNWSDNSDAEFTTTGEGTVKVESDVTASSVTIQDGASYTFDISNGYTLTTGTLTNSGSLALTGSGTIKTGATNNQTYLAFGASEFSGNLTFTQGWFDVANSTLNSGMTVTVTANTQSYMENTSSEVLNQTDVSIHLGNGSDTAYTFAANLVLDGEGGVVIRTYSSSRSITFSGSVTGTSATLQSNGGGAVTFTGTVDVGKYIAYQGSTTFSGSSTKLGTLELASDNGATSSVTFSGSSTTATVTSLTTEAAATTFTDSLTVTDSAELTVGSVSLSEKGSIEVTTDSDSTFTVTGNITTEGGTFNIASGSTVTATGADTESGTSTSIAGISGSGTLSIEGTSATTQFVITTANDFTGTVNVKEGYLQLNGTSIADTADLVLQASAGTGTTTGIYENTDVSIHFGVDGVSLGNDITVEGDGAVLIRTSGNSGTLSGDITASDAAYLQLNGNGSVTISGDVSLESGGYINYQGTTTFKDNTVTLKELDINQDGSTTSAVIFDGSTATVGTLNVENHGTGGADSEGLTVKNGATLTITEALAINHDITITLDAGTMSIADSGSVTVDTGKSASITISNGGQLSVGSGVELNNATINIVLGVENISSTVNPDSVVTTLDATGVYALTGEGTIGNDVTIKISVDDAVAKLLSEGGEYTFYVYDTGSGLSISENVTWNTTALDQYGYTYDPNSGTITIMPEPSMFGLFLGLGAIGLVATRRRKRA